MRSHREARNSKHAFAVATLTPCPRRAPRSRPRRPTSSASGGRGPGSEADLLRQPCPLGGTPNADGARTPAGDRRGRTVDLRGGRRRVVDINALRALAPPAPSPGHHAPSLAPRRPAGAVGTGGIVNINALRALAPLPRAPVSRPSRPQPRTPPPAGATGTAAFGTIARSTTASIPARVAQYEDGRGEGRGADGGVSRDGGLCLSWRVSRPSATPCSRVRSRRSSTRDTASTGPGSRQLLLDEAVHQPARALG